MSLSWVIIHSRKCILVIYLYIVRFIFLLLCFFLLIQVELHLLFFYPVTPLPCDPATFLLGQLWLSSTVLCYWQVLSPEYSPSLCVSPEYLEHKPSLRGQLAAFPCCESWSCIYTECFQVPEWLDIYLIEVLLTWKVFQLSLHQCPKNSGVFSPFVWQQWHSLEHFLCP